MMQVMFDDILAANAAYAAGFEDAGLGPRPAHRLAVVTCMDVRLDVFAMLGLELGEAHVIRNAGARLTDDVIRSLIAGVELLGVERVALIQHTDCGMASVTDEQLSQIVRERRGVDEVGVAFHTIDDHERAIVADVAALRASPLLPADLQVAGFLYDVTTGRLSAVEG